MAVRVSSSFLLLLFGLVAAVVVQLARQRQKRASRYRPAKGVLAPTAAHGDVKQAVSSPPTWPPPISPADLDWEGSDPRPFRPFKPVYHITMALQSSVPEDLIVLDRNYRDRIDIRRAVIVAHPKTVMGIIPSPDSPSDPSPKAKAAVDELYEYLMGSYLPARYPSAFRILAETVEDDFFLLQEENGITPVPAEEVAALPSAYPPTSHRLTAFLCCFASGFDPSSKLGLLLRDIHTPVPSYDKIGPSMERFFSRIQVGKNVKRLNWSVQTHSDLFIPKGNHIVEGDVFTEDEEIDITKSHMRVECQTVTRLPKTGIVLFSFKTYLFPIAEIKAEGLGPGLADAIQGLKQGNAPGMWVYKGAVRWGKGVCDYLRS
ncbi:hypothetical protein CMQ_13 [Grosmannia clavigera kw1407]|uniref:Uncharacterized protein n=1 Tax=Grosmannia clavigera (strain kw1407 / UAMH 11150) TaxID=655863 RepID=F0XQQ0_GROCL|nr:uncharacterized protein CMQ_13 [Grosmannia clavigera kw1407]EFW99695.1 hypothetical protein CMQ_13 [Grosmannia clavigera kw1407]